MPIPRALPPFTLLAAALLAPSPASAISQDEDCDCETGSGTAFCDDGELFYCIGRSDAYSDEREVAWMQYNYLRVVNHSGGLITAGAVALTEWSDGEWRVTAPADNFMDLMDIPDGEVVDALIRTEFVGSATDNLSEPDGSVYTDPLGWGYKWQLTLYCGDEAVHTVTDDDVIQHFPNNSDYHTVVVTEEICSRSTEEGWPEAFAYDNIYSMDEDIAEADQQSGRFETYKLNVINSDPGSVELLSVTLTSQDAPSEFSVYRDLSSADPTATWLTPGEESDFCDETVEVDGETLTVCDDTLRVSDTGWFQHEVSWGVMARCASGDIAYFDHPGLYDEDVSPELGDFNENYFYLWIHDCDAGLASWDTGYQPLYDSWETLEDDHAETAWMSRTSGGSAGDVEGVVELISEGYAPAALSGERWGDAPLAGIECQTTDGVPAEQSGETLSAYTLTDGCVCEASAQSDGECEDYQVKLHYGWTNWFTGLNGGGNALWLSTLKARDRIGCSAPTLAQMRYNGTDVYEVETGTGQTTLHNVPGAKWIRLNDNNTYGMRCNPLTNGDCSGWEYRYYCAG